MPSLPIPSAYEANLRHHLLWHPLAAELWMFDISPFSVRRVDRHGAVSDVRPPGSGLAIPEGFSALYLNAAGFYFDTVRQTAVWLLGTYAGDVEGTGLALGAVDSASARPLAQENGIRPVDGDGFVFDPLRGVLVHFAGTADTDGVYQRERLARGGLTVREFAADGAWRDVGRPLPGVTGQDSVAGWDARLGCAVFVDGTGSTHGWDGHDWLDLPPLANGVSQDSRAGQSPRTGALIVVQPEGWSPPRAGGHELGEAGWRRCDPAGLAVFGGLARDPVRERTWVYGPWFGEGAPQYTLGEYDGDRFAPAAGMICPLTAGSTGGPVRFLGPWRADVALDSTVRPLVFMAGDDLTFAGPGLAGVAHLLTGAGHLTLAQGGGVFRDGRLLAPPPPGYDGSRLRLLGADDAGRLLIAHGGEAPVWLFDGVWTRLTPAGDGKMPYVREAAAAFDPVRAVWLVVGGDNQRRLARRWENRTSELDGRRWRNYWSVYSDDPGAGREADGPIGLLAVDPKTGAVLCVRSRTQEPGLYVYRGKGAWLHIATLAVDFRPQAFAWDDAGRAVVAAGPDGLQRLPVGEPLDRHGAGR